MTANPILNFALVLLAIVALRQIREWFREQVICDFRAELFGLRRRLFVLASTSSALRPTDLVYVRLRNIMNGLLLQAESITFGQVLLTLVRAQGMEVEDKATIGLVNGVKDPELHRELQSIHREIGNISMRQMGRTSWFSAFLPLILFFMARNQWAALVGAIEAQGAVRSEFERAPA